MDIADLPDYSSLRQVQQALWGAKEVRGAAVMVGAGFSKFARLASQDGRPPPLWSDFEAEMRKRLHGESLPTDPLKLAEQYSTALGRHALDALIRDLVCDHQWTPGVLHSRLMGLPWADVLTTNWDTLLERTELDEPDRGYEVVRVLSDIARTRAPRIVKLHGSLPSHEPFIFTAEDFRTYPKLFAPFVNLAQQVLLENELCLIGFSGDDPNFLQWSGWVRDQLGASARRIRLIGVLNLSPSRRQVLEHYNISPIDLAPLVEHGDAYEKHLRAMTLFIDSLWAAKPKPLHLWVRHKDRQEKSAPASDKEALLRALAQNWREDRERYPGWLVAPYSERMMLEQDTLSLSPELWSLLRKGNADTRALVVYELIWRYETAFVPITEDLAKFVEEMLQQDTTALTASQRAEIRMALLRAARRRRDWTSFEGIAGTLAQESAPKVKEALAYERALRCRDELDFVGLAATIDSVAGGDPAWQIRRAALQCELGQDEKAAETLFSVWKDVRERRAQDRQSIWLLSREAWAGWLMKRVHFTLRDNPEHRKIIDDAYDRWPVRYKAANCDPWDETTYFDHEISEEVDRRYKESETIQPRFDPGTYRDQSKTIRFGSATPSFYELFALADHVGLSSSIDHFDVLGSRFVRSLEVTQEISDVTIWAAVLRLPKSSDGLIDHYFSRIKIARMRADLVSAIIAQLKQTIEYGRTQFATHDWVSRTVKYTELLSRFAVRLSPDEAVKMFNWAISLSNDNEWKHWWLFEPLANLLNRSLEAVPPSKRSALTLSAIQLRLPKDSAGGGIEHNWPELAFQFDGKDYSVRDSSYAWSHTIRSLIETVRSHTDLNRTRAIWRLVAMHDGGILSDAEKTSFGEALWSRRQGKDGFPDNADLYGHVFLRLPEPEAGLGQRAFGQNIVRGLVAGDINEFRLNSLSGSARDFQGAIVAAPLTIEDAKRILKNCLEWKPKELKSPNPFAQSKQQEIEHYIGPCLSNAVLPLLSARDIEADCVQKWTDALAKGGVESLIQTTAQFARIFPEREAEAISSIRRGLAGRTDMAVNSAVVAINHLIKLRISGPVPFPSVLSADVVALCVTRREPGLLMLLACARRLLTARLIAAGDEKRLAEALELLLIETSYESWDPRDPRTRSLSLVRRECVRLADQLKQHGVLGDGIEDWLASFANDPVPEVRFALMSATD